MKRSIVYIFTFVSVFVLAVSCKAEEPKPVTPILIEIETTPLKQDTLLAGVAGVSSKMMDQAIKFRNALLNEQNYRSGIYVYDTKSVTTYLNNPSKLAARIALLGLKDVYLGVTKGALDGTDAIKQTWIRNFNTAAHLYGLTVWALRLSSNTAYVSDAAITDECSRILSFNLQVAATEKFDAVSADWEPHVLTEGGVDTPAGLQYFWDSSTNYGIGGSNDMLLKRTMEMFSIAKQKLGTLPVNEAIHYMYQNNYNAGLLSYGNTLQFLNSCDYVTVMSYTDTKEKVWSRGLSTVDNAQGKSKKVSICIKVSLNTYGGGDATTSLYPKGWNYLKESLNYFYTQGASKTGFRGIDFFEFEGLEQLWNTTDTSTMNVQSNISGMHIQYNNQSQTIEFRDLTSSAVYELYSMNGELIRSSRINSSDKISLNQLSKGNYLVRLQNGSELPTTFKFTK